MPSLDLDTRVSGAEGRYRAVISSDWEVWGPNGGYVAAIALRAAGADARLPRPVAFAGQNLEGRPVDPGLWQEGRPVRSPVIRQWYRYRPVARFDDPFVNAARALVLIDTLVWPAACQRHLAPDFTAPNLDIVAWFHRPAHDSEWLLADAIAPIAESGLIGGEGPPLRRDHPLLGAAGAALLLVPAAAPHPRP